MSQSFSLFSPDTSITIIVQAVTEIGGVVVHNTVAFNSYKGTLYTDKGQWSAPAAKVLGKEHGLCTKHESTAISGASAGHEEASVCPPSMP